jgi:hypothetical protein
MALRARPTTLRYAAIQKNSLTFSESTGKTGCMKKQQPKEKIGSIYASAIAIGLTPEKAKKLLQLKNATELRAQWDYRSRGMTIMDARAALASAATRQSYHSSQSGKFLPYQFCPLVLDHLTAKKEHDKTRQSNFAKIATSQLANTLEEMKHFTNGYDCGYGCFVLLEENFLVIKRNESVTWSDKKSWKWPTSRHTSYSLTLISPAGDTIASALLENRNGDWLEKVGLALGLATGKRNQINQTASMIPVRKTKRFDLTITELRLFGVGFSIFCASRENFHYHASSQHEAIRGLVRKMYAHKANLLDDSKLVTLQQARKLGFCPTGIQEFLKELGWEGRISSTAGEIRQAIRNVDVSPWMPELVTIGILGNSHQS